MGWSPGAFSDGWRADNLLDGYERAVRGARGPEAGLKFRPTETLRRHQGIEFVPSSVCLGDLHADGLEPGKRRGNLRGGPLVELGARHFLGEPALLGFERLDARGERFELAVFLVGSLAPAGGGRRRLGRRRHALAP